MAGEVEKLKDDTYQATRSVIARVAHALARKYGRFVEAEDVAQELWVWCLQHTAKVVSFVERDGPGERRAGLKGLQKSLYRIGDRHCRKEKANRSGYRVSDEFFYNKTLIEALLVAKFNDGKMLERGVDTNVKRSKSLAEGGDIQAMIGDLNVALDALDEATRVMLVDHVVGGVTTGDIARELGISRQAVDQRITRSMDRMIDALGGPSPYA